MTAFETHRISVSNTRTVFNFYIFYTFGTGGNLSTFLEDPVQAGLKYFVYFGWWACSGGLTVDALGIAYWSVCSLLRSRPYCRTYKEKGLFLPHNF
jgi:hypothetical protein